MKQVGLIFSLISGIIIAGILIRLAFGVGILLGLFAIALILGVIGVTLVDSVEKEEEYYDYDEWL